MLAWVKGGGDLASGTAHRLHRSGFDVVISELRQPTVIRRAVSFATAIFESQCTVEGVTAVKAEDVQGIRRALAEGLIPVVPDPTGDVVVRLMPHVVIDARMAKRNLGSGLSDAPIVIALGPGFVAGRDAHAVIETMRGHDLGRIILSGAAQADTGIPGAIGGVEENRVLRAPCAGTFSSSAHIGQSVAVGDAVGSVAGVSVISRISGVLRGLLYSGLPASIGQKIGDVDPRGEACHCFTISDKSRAIAGTVLEAILYLSRQAGADIVPVEKGWA